MIDDRSKMRHGDMPLLDRIEAAMHRVTNGEGQMRVPVEATDPDVVLYDCRREIERLRAELAEATRDAARYRWLAKEHGGLLLRHFPAMRPYIDASEVIDEAIDAARKQGDKSW